MRQKEWFFIEQKWLENDHGEHNQATYLIQNGANGWIVSCKIVRQWLNNELSTSSENVKDVAQKRPNAPREWPDYVSLASRWPGSCYTIKMVCAHFDLHRDGATEDEVDRCRIDRNSLRFAGTVLGRLVRSGEGD